MIEQIFLYAKMTPAAGVIFIYAEYFLLVLQMFYSFNIVYTNVIL